MIGIALKYSAMPALRPRIENLFMTGFQFVAYCMALVYSALRLLPANHPYTNPQNMGKYGIRHVIAQAANNLVLKRNNIDQIILFVALLIGIIIIFAQVVLLGFALFTQPVFAALPTNFADFFITQNPERDIAHIMMDLVFGAGPMGNGDASLFNSCVAQGITCQETTMGGATRNVMADEAGTSIFADYGFPFPIHVAMHQMFQLYNTGLLVVAAFITTYFMITVVAETAQTGTAFGKRFNKVWAPIRIVFAFGMLVPVGIGLNGSQWSVLYAAKFGSGFATNGWELFNTQIGDGYFGDLRDLVSQPQIPETAALLQFFYVARTCAHLEDTTMPIEERERTEDRGGDDDTGPPELINMYLVKNVAGATGQKFERVDAGTTYDNMLQFVEETSTVRIRFGIQHSKLYGQQIGSVHPHCGEVIFKLLDSRRVGAEPAIQQMQEAYWEILRDLWHTTYTTGTNYPENQVLVDYGDDTAQLPPIQFKAERVDEVKDDLQNAARDAVDALADSPRFDVNDIVTEKGWAGAAIWYNRIAEMNGAVTTSILNIPYPSLYPDLMEQVLARKKETEQTTSFDTRFFPVMANGDPVQFSDPSRHGKMAMTLWNAFDYWQKDGVTTTHAAPTGNAFIDSVNAIFGTAGLFNIRKNPNTHPLAQIVGVGRSLVEASIRNLTLSVVGGASAKLLGFVSEGAPALANVTASFLVTVTMVALTAGFVLFYIVPFLPFIYFFFAVGGWIKGIFEAMVGAPLWALAHIRIDQNGLPGQAGVAGYFLIFEIFLRPILIIFGMLASISIFSALVGILHQVFDVVISNVGGFDNELVARGGDFEGLENGAMVPMTADTTSLISVARNAVDEFFFTIIYTIIIYLMAMSSFKLIDLIPNNILRWMGQSIATFNDQREDAAQGLVGKATVGSQQTSGALGGGLKKFVGSSG